MASEQNFQSWASAPGRTEQDKCDNAVSAVSKALDADATLNPRSIRVFAQGSYCNRTNVRQDSDVDVCVRCLDTIFYDLPPGMAPADFGLTVPTTYPYSQYKNEVGAALTSYFKTGQVTRGNKALDIKENTYRIAADAVACFLYKKFAPNGTALEGIAFLTDGGQRIVNWPEQNYQNGVEKNRLTGTRFKDVARIFKRVRYAMKDAGSAAADPIPSFLLECLAYNVPNDKLMLSTYTLTIRESILHLFTGTQNEQGCATWKEVNGQKDLFGTGQAWTFQQVNAFIVAMWGHLEFK